MDINEMKFLNAWNAIPGVGAVTLRALKNHFSLFEKAWRASDSAYALLHLDTQAHEAILARKKSVDPDREIQKLARGNIWMITEENPEYPAMLKEIPVSPVALYGRGSKEALSAGKNIAVVGTRRPTPYGLESADAIVAKLADAGMTIVSGLATGIDTRAHKAALAYKSATVAVLGSGVDSPSIFPPENRGLAERITSSGGAVISEYSPGTPPVKEHFPMRNRIISGLARGTLVVEAREKSGALITARYALEQNRDVFAVPGSIFSATSAGPNALIREGALAVSDARHILEALGIEYAGGEVLRTDAEVSPEESALLEILATPHSIDAIKEKTGRSAGAIMASLSLLELNGRIKNIGNGTFQKI